MFNVDHPNASQRAVTQDEETPASFTLRTEATGIVSERLLRVRIHAIPARRSQPFRRDPHFSKFSCMKVMLPVLRIHNRAYSRRGCV